MNQSIESQLQHGMQQQLQQWREALKSGSERIGWKVGFNRESDQQAAGLAAPQIGYLLQERCYPQQGHHHCIGDCTLLVEGEIAIQLTNTITTQSTRAEIEAAIGGYATALELVNSAKVQANGITALLASNLMHEAVVVGQQTVKMLELNSLSATLTVNGEVVRTLDTSRVPATFIPLLEQIANTLASHGEQLQAGDWIITGAATTPIAVKQGDHIQFKLGELDTVSLTINHD
ncbi:MAG: fumarylacetoacetate hydrolase family protein [Gammaproteobacteria bacterium]|nr:fumarylacetoacetate hydrolase family protein [Gammaproteobacteria bacterium]